MTGTIQTGIDLLPATGAMVQLLDGTFNIASSLVLDSYQTLQGCGKNTILTTTTDNLKIITATGGSGTEKIKIAISDLQLDGNSVGDVGIFLEYIDYSTIQNVYLTDFSYGSGTYKTGVYLIHADFNQLTNNFCQDNGGSGVMVYTSTNNIFIGNTCNGNTSYGICLYLSSVYNTIFSNFVQNSTYYGIGVTGSSDNNIVSNNTIQGIGRYGLDFDNSDRNIISSNTVHGSGRHGTFLTSCHNNIITGNSVIESSLETTNTYDDIYLSDSDYNSLQANICRAGDETEKPRYGINISNAGCNSNKVINNDLYDDGFGTGAFNDDGTGTIYVEPGIDDTPVNGETGQPISSNWAYDHNADTTANNALIWAIVFGG